jgi:hypothetical protein
VRFNRWVLSAVALTGLSTGLFVASAEEFFQRDGALDGTEALAPPFVPLPLLAALFVSREFSIGLRRHRLALRITGQTLDLVAVRKMAVVAYLIFFIRYLESTLEGPVPSVDAWQWRLLRASLHQRSISYR